MFHNKVIVLSDMQSNYSTQIKVDVKIFNAQFTTYQFAVRWSVDIAPHLFISDISGQKSNRLLHIQHNFPSISDTVLPVSFDMATN